MVGTEHIWHTAIGPTYTSEIALVDDDNALDEPYSWKGFSWGEPTDERTELLDAIYGALAQWICSSQAAEQVQGNHRPDKFGGQPCQECQDVAWRLVNGSLSDLLSKFGRAACEAGRNGLCEVDAAIHALRVVGQPIDDRLSVEEFLRRLV